MVGGGGGGAVNNAWNGVAGVAGVGGGGNGTKGGAGTSALANTGGGGGGGNSSNGGSGGSGIILIKNALAFENMDLVSNATTANAVPTKGDLVLTYTNGSGTATINTDLKGFVSRNNGTNYTEGTLVLQGTTGGHTILAFHDLDISGQPSGTAMRYKVSTSSQSSAKSTRIHAVSLGWS